MAEVKWTGRRISDGVLVDVTGDTEGAVQGAPTPNVLEQSGVQTVSMLGPYPVAFNTPGLNSGGITLATLEAGQVVVKAWIVITVVWNASVSAGIGLRVKSPPGGNSIAHDLVFYDAKAPTVVLNPAGGDEYMIENRGPDPVEGLLLASVVAVIASSTLLTVEVAETGTAATSGEAIAYVLIAEPA